MFRRASLLLVIAVLLILTAANAGAQTGVFPQDDPAICAPETPCGPAEGSGPALQIGTALMEAQTSTAEAAAQDEPVLEGFGLAWVIMGLLVLALLYALSAAVMSTLGRAAPLVSERAVWLVPVLAVAGLVVALYMTYVETQDVAAVCGPLGDCNAVQSSPFATLFGFLPVGLLGAMGYVAILVAWGIVRFTSGMAGRMAALMLFLMVLFGVLFSIYLTYLELYVIRAVCAWCLSSAVIMALLMVLVVRPAIDAVQGDDLGE